MSEPFDKAMHRGTDWARLYERQRLRSAQIAEWLDLFALQAGERVLDVGAGSGYVSLEAARRVGAGGMVYAVDRSAAALDFLADRQREAGLAQVRGIVADAAVLPPLPEPIDAFLITMMLHHVESPAALLRHLGTLLPPGARGLIAEFHPEGPCEKGPPREHRIHPDQATGWCDGAGLSVTDYRRQSPEHYLLQVQVQGRPD